MDLKVLLLNPRVVLTLLIIIYAKFVICQVSDSFNDGNFTENPEWSGDISDFIINDDLQLQLQSDGSGSSYLFTEIPTLADSASIEIYGQLDFSPSSSNYLRIYFLLDAPDLDLANGYFIEIGESGSDDALRFYKLTAGEESQLAVGEPSTVASPVSFRIRLERDPDGLWSVHTSYDEEIQSSFELSFFDNDFLLESGFFALECNYTSSRADKFYFDDLIITELLPDLEPPIALVVDITGSNTLEVCFDEPIEPSISASQFRVEGIGQATSISILSDPACIGLTFGVDFVEGTSYLLEMVDVEDLAGNPANTTIEFTLNVPVRLGDIIINEILFDPHPGGADFVEFYNRSDQALSLDGLIIRNQGSGAEVVVDLETAIPAMGYLALTEDVDYLEQTYNLLDPKAVVTHPLPAFANASGNVSLILIIEGEEIVLDQFTYTEDLHNPIIDDTEGVSLERKDPGQEEAQDNWSSASSVAGFATPGYQNSILTGGSLVEEGLFEIKKKVFSPNGDGNEDFLEINYGLPSDSYVLVLKVFDINGNFVKEVYSNELLSTSGTLVWDGTGKNNEKLELGIYILWFEIFTPNGDVKYFKETAVIADFLN